MEDVVELAKGRWHYVLPALGIHEDFLRKKHGPCPLCGGKDRYRFIDKNGTGSYYCNGCGPGSGFDMVMKKHGWEFKDAAKEVRRVLGGSDGRHYETIPPVITHEEKLTPEVIEKRRKILNSAWSLAAPVIKTDVVGRYLKNRGLPEMENYPSVLRFRSSMMYMLEDKDMGNYPVMLALVQAADGKPINLHRTYLTSQGVKAPFEDCKKMMKKTVEHMAGCAIRLFKPERQLAIAEGIETALAVHAMTGLPVWATISAPLMRSVVLPADVEEVYIFADNDPMDEKGKRAGIDAAIVLKDRLVAEGKKVQIILPKDEGTDFLDVYLSKQLISEKKKAA